MSAIITHALNHFAVGSYKQVYDTIPASSNSVIKFEDDVDTGIKKVISKIRIYNKTPLTVDEKKEMLANTLSEFEMQMLFESVKLAPTIYAMYFIVVNWQDNKPINTHFAYYLDDILTVNSVYQDIQKHLHFGNNETLYVYVLSAACLKQEFDMLIGTGNPITDMKHALELIDTYIQKIVYSEYLLMDFKPSNMCVMESPTTIIGLDFDRQFILHFSQIPLAKDIVARVSRTYMFVLAALLLSDIDPNSIKQLIRERHLTGSNISEMFSVFVGLEKTGHNLCKNKYNPLSMLAYYVLTSRYLENADVLKCLDLNEPINTWQIIKDKPQPPSGLLRNYPNFLTSNLAGYEIVKRIIVNEIFGVDEYNAEKTGTRHLINPYISPEFAEYKKRVSKLTAMPVIPYTNETVDTPMFSSFRHTNVVDVNEPPRKKFKNGGLMKRPSIKPKSMKRHRHPLRKTKRRKNIQ